jgi:hypothetical protein
MPLVRLTIGLSGISIRPAAKHFGDLWRLLGVPVLAFDWSEIGEIESVASLFSLRRPVGVSFMTAAGKRLVFWTYAPEAILDELGEYVPDKIVERDKPKFVI